MMNAVALMLATAVLGVDYGWHRLPNGEWEYIIQIEPALVQTLMQGQSLVSQMPPELQGVRRFRVQVAEGEVKRDPLPTQPIGMTPGAFGAQGSNVGIDPGRSAFGSPNRFAAGSANWPIGIDPQSMAGLRHYEWVGLDPIDMNPLENELLRQWGGPDPVSRDERPWEHFNRGTGGTGTGSGFPPSSPWQMQPGSGGRLTDPRDRTANANSAFGMSRNAGRNLQTPAPQGTTNGGFVPPWRLDQNPSVYPSDPRDSGLWPRPDAGAGQNRRDLDRLDLNEDEHGDGDLPGGTTSFPAKGSLGNSRFASRTGSRPTQRGMLDDRDSVRHASATTGRGGSTNYAADDPRGATHQFAPTRTGMLGEQAVNKQVWWPLTMTLVLLFASFGGNLYLGWLALDFYRRYREAAWELRTSEGPLN